jgi:ribose 1,5-bisphosphokinase PhnN
MRLDLSGTRAVRVPDPDRLAALVRIECVVIVGSTCAGKSTLVDAIRASEMCRLGRVDVPTRYITRPPRGSDNLVENVHLSPEQFDAGVRNGAIGLRWVRHLEAGRVVRYGFGPPLAGAVPVYSANNAIYAGSSEVRPEGALTHALLIGVYTPDAIRAERLRRRSPDLWSRPGEVDNRLADRASNIEPHVHLVIADHDELEAVAPLEIVSLVTRASSAV